MTVLTQHLGANLQRLRLSRDFSQTHLAARAGLTQKYISNLERGLRPSRIAHVERLARALDIDVIELLGLQGPSASDTREAKAAR